MIMVLCELIQEFYYYVYVNNNGILFMFSMHNYSFFSDSLIANKYNFFNNLGVTKMF